MIWIPQLLSGLLLVGAVSPHNPYAYYILLRWVCGPSLAFLALKAREWNKQGLVWSCGVAAILYNPILPVHLNRPIWSVINIATLALIVATIFALSPSAERKAS